MKEIEGMHDNEMINIELIVYDILKTFHLKYREEKTKKSYKPWFPKNIYKIVLKLKITKIQNNF